MNQQQLKAVAEQQLALQELLRLYDSGETELKLAGLAGTGKTQLACELVQELTFRMKEASPQANVVCAGAAIAHSAKNVLAKRFRAAGLDIKCYTIAALLRLTKYTTDSGKQLFITNKQGIAPIRGLHILIVDEASQITESVKQQIRLSNLNCIVIYLGDWHQTKPIDDKSASKDSVVFSLPGANLTTPFRYDGDTELLASAIAEKIDDPALDENIKHLAFLRPFIHSIGKDYLFMRDETAFLDMYLADIKANYELNSNVLINYRKKANEEFNLKIRKLHLESLFKNVDLTKLYPGEILICNRGETFEDGPAITNHGSYKVLGVTETIVYAVLAESVFFEDPPMYYGKTFVNVEVEDQIYLPIPVYLVSLQDNTGRTFDNIQILQDPVNPNYLRVKELLGGTAREKMKSVYWTEYYGFLESFHDFSFAYACNVHIVQGEEYNNVYVNLKDVLDVRPITLREKLQSFYTAVTRAKKKVIILY